MRKAYFTLFAAASLLIVSCAGGKKDEDKKSGGEDKKKSEKKDEDKKKEVKKVSYTVDTAKTTLRWQGSHTKKEEKKHVGTVKITDGMLTMKGDKIQKGSFIVDLTTINNTGQEGKMKENLMGHLMSPDFFNVEKHPKAKLNITGHKDGKVMGDLQVVGNKMPVTIAVKPKKDGDHLTADGSFTVDFSKAEMKGMQPEEGKKDKGHVSNKVKFELELVMNKK